MDFHAKARTILLLLIVLGVGAPALYAQRKAPHIGYVFPAGAQRGTTCEIVMGGQFLDGSKELLVTNSGVKATLVRVEKPLQQKRLTELRDYLMEARKKAMEAGEMRPWNGPAAVTRILKEAGASEEEASAFLKERQQRNNPKRQQNQQISEMATIKVEIAPDAPTGPCEIRLLAPTGLSNPLFFCVSRLLEQTESGESGKTIDTAQRVVLPTVLNGQILPGEVDHFSFQARRGARLVIAVQGRDLLPYLADAVPGWFQPVVTLYDSKIKEVAYANDYRFSPDPVLCYDVPTDGVYLLQIKDALYRGREDFVYRVTVGEVPFVTGIFPLGGRTGSDSTVEVAGWNIPRPRAVVKAEPDEGIHRVADLANGFVVGDVAFATDRLAEAAEQEPNDSPKTAQSVKLPVIVNGRIDTPGDVDVFAFSCEAGTKVVAEVTARRLNSPLDSWLKITNEAGRQIAFNDDKDDKGAGMLTHQADSYVAFTAPARGRYFVHLGNAQRKGGPEFAYRLRISPPQPDFALRLVPSSLNARPGANLPVTVYAVRKDGFSGDITLAFKDAPEGFALQGGYIPAGQDKIRATVTFPQAANPQPVPLAVEGKANVAGHEISHAAVPADDLLQAFIYHHLVPASGLFAFSMGETMRGKAPLKASSADPVKLVPGNVTRMTFTMPYRLSADEAVQFQLSEPPEGVSIESATSSSEGVVLSFWTDSAVKPGLCGNLIAEAFRERTLPAQGDKKSEKRRYSIGFLPAIPFQVAGH